MPNIVNSEWLTNTITLWDAWWQTLTTSSLMAVVSCCRGEVSWLRTSYYKDPCYGWMRRNDDDEDKRKDNTTTRPNQKNKRRRRTQTKKKLCREFKSKKIRRLLHEGSVMWCAKCNVSSRFLSCKIFIIVVVVLPLALRTVVCHGTGSTTTNQSTAKTMLTIT